VDQIDHEILRFGKTVQVTLEIASSKAKVAASLRHDPLAILCWSCAAKEAGDSAVKLATLKGIKPTDSANSDVNGTVWEMMKTCLCQSAAMTPNEVDRLGLYLLTDTKSGDRIPELRQLQVNALERLKGKAKEVANVMIDALRNAKYQLVASDFLTQERAVFMRKQSEVMQQQEEARQNASAVAGDAAVSALEKIKRQNDAAILMSPAQIADLVKKEVAENNAKKPNLTVVLWPGAENTPTNIRIARSRTAILESGGNVKEAQELLRREGNGIALSTLYGHKKILDKRNKGWNSGTVSKQLGNLENGVSPRIDGKQWVPTSKQ